LYDKGGRSRSTAKERDQESGLDYFGARYFGSSLGRFTSPDVPLLDQSPADPQSWNLYGYVRNNPLVFIDPSGRSTVVAADGTVIDAQDDDDTNVYLVYVQVTFDPVAFVNSGGGEGVSAQSGRFKVGETEFADEFVAYNSETGELTGGAAEGARILFGESFDADITGLNAESNALGLGLASTAWESANGGRFDIKLNTAIAPFGSNTGKLLGGKYATARSAGNYLAGLNAATGTVAGSQITFSTMSRLAGALHHGGRVGVARALLGADLGREIPQSQRRIEQGFPAGRGVAVGPLR
jgi:RHS repeat-associated protein